GWKSGLTPGGGGRIGSGRSSKKEWCNGARAPPHASRFVESEKVLPRKGERGPGNGRSGEHGTQTGEGPSRSALAFGGVPKGANHLEFPLAPAPSAAALPANFFFCLTFPFSLVGPAHPPVS